MQIDGRAFPLIVVRWDHPASDAELVRFISEMTALAERAVSQRLHYAVVSVGESPFTAAQRRKLSAWIEARPTEKARWDLGNYIVVQSAVARGVLTAMRWMTPKLEKVYTYGTLDDALRAARERLVSANGTQRNA